LESEVPVPSITNTKSLSVFPFSVVGMLEKVTDEAELPSVCDAIGM
jgi:hypothetical protein